MTSQHDERVLSRLYLPGEPGYERLRLSAARSVDWNQRTVDRHPAGILQATEEAEVIAAISLAREWGWTVKARSGGHSWTDSSVREGALLIDLSAMTRADLDLDAGFAKIGPGLKGQELDRLLEPHGWYFPTGGCMDVGLGGFLLQGGFGFNRQVIGPACRSVQAVDVVTAAGELVHASSTENPDLYWAARGAGSGFFGIVTCFYVGLHRLPDTSLSSTHLFAIDDADELIRWLMDEHDHGRFPPEMMAGVTVCPALGTALGTADQAAVLLRGSVSAGSADAAREMLSILNEVPLRSRALHSELNSPIVVSERRGLARAMYPDGGTYIADNMWTNAGPEQLAPMVADALRDLPSRRSHLALEAYHPHELPDMAFSVEGRYWLALYGVGDSAGQPDEAELVDWTTRHLTRMDHLSEGIQLADENLIARPANGLRPENAARLEKIRQQYDPKKIFESYLLPLP